MTDLRQWIRDPDLPAQAGEPELRPPTDGEVERLFRNHLLRADAPRLQSVAWEYARWKPGVSLTCTYRLALEDGSEELAVFKRYSGDKARVLAGRPVKAAQPYKASETLGVRVVLPTESVILWSPLGDRELGLRYLLDFKRFPKLLRDSGLVEQGLVRRRRTVFELLRYKPERRAVYRVRVRLRDEARPRFSMAARVLPPQEVACIAEHRAAFEAAGGTNLAPTLACAHVRHGILVEPWLEVEAHEPDDFDAAGEAGEMLARLHGLVAPAAQATPFTDPRSFLPLLGAAPDLAQRLAAYVWPSTDGGAVSTWVHGDFHPDQLARGTKGPLLMDLDCLRPGDPTRDLASWVADHLFEDPAVSWDEAVDPLLAGYVAAGGRVPGFEHLRALVARELVARGAASVRRLERGAIHRARSALDRVDELLAD